LYLKVVVKVLGGSVEVVILCKVLLPKLSSRHEEVQPLALLAVSITAGMVLDCCPLARTAW